SSDGAVRPHPARRAAGTGARAAPARRQARHLRRDADDGQAGPHHPRRADGVRDLRRRGGADRDGALPRGVPPRGAAAVRSRPVPAAGKGRGVVWGGDVDRHAAGTAGPLRQAARPAVAGDLVTKDKEAQRRRGELFRRLHSGKPILVLPNVWDVASARIVEQAGFPALATSSAGVAFALGYPDGERISREEMAAAVARIVAHVAVPVTADMESGYGRRPEDAAATVRAAIEAGAVGMNFEDSPGEGGEPLLDEALQVERIRAARKAADATGVPFVLNARGFPGRADALHLQRF